jgi:hypothetical protein
MTVSVTALIDGWTKLVSLIICKVGRIFTTANAKHRIAEENDIHGVLEHPKLNHITGM